MKRKFLCSILAMLIILASIPMTVFAADEVTITKVDLTATKTLTEGYECHIEYDGETEEPFYYYYLNDTLPDMTLTFSDGSTKDITFDEYWDYFEDSMWCEQGAGDKELKPGTHTKTVCLTCGYNEETGESIGVMAEYTFTIEPNPIESISAVATKSLVENVDGHWEDKIETDENGDEVVVGQTFFYDVTDTEPTITINYKNGETKTYPYDAVLDETGYDIMTIDNNNHENPYKLCDDNVAKVSVLGVEAEFTFEIVENPIKTISARATKDLAENQNGTMNGEGLGGVYFHYYISDTEPEVTVTYTDGEVKTYTYQEISNLGEEFSVYAQQSGDKPLKPGTNTGIVEFAGIKCEFTFKITEDPVKNIVAVSTRDLVQYEDGYNMEGSDGKYFFCYDLCRTYPTVTINYKDGTSKTYTYDEIRRYADFSLFINDFQDSTSQLKVGTNKTTISVNGVECEYKFNVKKAEKTVTSISVVPQGKLIENTNGYIDYENEDKEFFVYYPYALKYNVTIKYSDGTTKTLKNIYPYQEIDGSDFDIYFDCHTYDSRFTIGKNNTGVAYYKNATCTFPVEVVKNDYKAIEISGDNNFVVTFIKQDNSKVVYTADSMDIIGMGEGQLGIMFEAENGVIELVINYELNKDGTSLQNISVTSGEKDYALKSNTLASNKWLDMAICLDNIAYIAPTYADGYSKRYYNRDFNGINGAIKDYLVDDALAMCTVDEFYKDYENWGEDEKGQFAIISLEEAKTLLKKYFDPAKVDITSSPMYNAAAKEIKVYFIRYAEGFISDEKLEYLNGKFVYTADWVSEFTDKTTPVAIVLADTGYVESISFVKGACGTIKTINADNAKNGVKVTYSASENASQYEIYRSTNGGKYEKVGTSDELVFVDKTVVSGKTYTYKVRGINPTDTGKFGGAKTVSYLATPKTTATVTKTGYTVKWTKVDGASTYRIYRAEYLNGKWSNWNKLSDQKASVTSFKDKNIKAGGVYKYTVRAMASGGVASAYEGTPILVYLTTPAVKIANAKGGVKGSWNAVTGAEGYIVYRSELSNGKWSAWTNLGTAKATTKSFTDKTAVSGKTYRYTVKAVNGDNKSLYTASNTLLYLAEPTVTISNAKSGVVVKWTKSEGAKNYIVYRAQYNASTKKWSSWKSIGTPDSTKTSFTDKNVTSGVKYKYTVKAVNGKIKSTFTSSASLVRLLQPTVKISNTKTGITVKWNKITGTTGYKIYRQELVNGKWSKWESLDTAKANKTSWTDTKVESGATYRYAVRAKNGKYLSSYTATESLMFLAMPTTSVVNASSGIKVTWLESAGATKYIIYRSEYNAKTKKWSGWSKKQTVDSLKTSWTDKNVTSGVKYKYTVKAISGSFKSTFTSSSHLIYLAQPIATAAKTTSGIVVKWTKSAGTESYIIYRQEMTDGAWSKWESLTTAKATENSYTDKTVESGKEYRYTVCAVNGKYKSSYEASNSVKR